MRLEKTGFSNGCETLLINVTLLQLHLALVWLIARARDQQLKLRKHLVYYNPVVTGIFVSKETFLVDGHQHNFKLRVNSNVCI